MGHAASIIDPEGFKEQAREEERRRAERQKEGDRYDAGGFKDILTALHNCKLGAARHFLRSDPASVHQKDESGMTALHLAARCENDLGSVLQLAIEMKAAIEAKNKQGRTPLHVACQEVANHYSVKWLIKYGAFLEAADDQGRRPLHLVAKSWFPESICAEELVEAGANPEAKDNEGITPLRMAGEAGRDSTVRKFCEALEVRRKEEQVRATGWYARYRDSVFEAIGKCSEDQPEKVVIMGVMSPDRDIGTLQQDLRTAFAQQGAPYDGEGKLDYKKMDFRRVECKDLEDEDVLRSRTQANKCVILAPSHKEDFTAAEKAIERHNAAIPEGHGTARRGWPDYA